MTHAEEQWEANILRYGPILLFLLLSALFIANFVVLNNSGFILYSFPLFIILGFFGFLSERLSRYEIIASLSFIVAGALLYSGKLLMQYYAIFSLVVFLFISIFINGTEHKILAYSFFALPDALYFIGFISNANFAINSAIIGYYLLISAVISLFLTAAAGDSKFHAKIIKALSHETLNARLKYAAIIIMALLILAPVWPLGESMDLSILPHATVVLNNFYLKPIALNNTIYSYPVLLNESLYANYTTANFSNAQFFYPGNVKINATLHPTTKAGIYIADLLLNLSESKALEDVYLYFMPMNYSNKTVTYGRLISNISGYSGNRVDKIAYSGGYVNRSKKVYIINRTEATENLDTYFYPYYQLDSYCSPGYNITYNVSLSFSKNASFFELYNASNFLSGINLAKSDNYVSYLKSFAKNSFESFYNVSHVDSSFYSNDSCFFFVVVTQNQTIAKGEIGSHYNKIIGYNNVTFKLPDLFMNVSKYMTEKYSFAWNNMGYVSNQYKNYSSTQNGK